MKIAILNDTHTGIKNSNEVFLNNAAEFYSETFFPYLEKNGITNILHLGDYWDNRKSLNVKSIYYSRKYFIEPMIAQGITMDIIRGNHDTFYKDTGHINSVTEMLMHYDNINIIEDPTVIDYAGVKVGLVPWIDAANQEECNNFINTAECDIIAGHFEIIGCEMIKGAVSTHGHEPAMFDRFDKVLSGHFHTKSTRSNIWYLGSQLEFYWNDAHDDKHFHIYDTETGEIEKVKNPHTLYCKIFYNDGNRSYINFDFTQVENKFVKIIVEQKTNTTAFDWFVDMLHEQHIRGLQIAENFDEFTGNGVSDNNVEFADTTTLLNTYIDGVDTALDKERLKNEAASLKKKAEEIIVE